MPKLGMEPIRRAAVIHAALECICEKGTERITLEMVAQRAGCSKGVVAYYFKSKKGLVLECLKAFFSYYGKKISGSLMEGMGPAAMMAQVIHHSLPPLDGLETEQPLNINPLDHTEDMHIPLELKARLFIQFFSLAMTDPEAQAIIRDIYGKDVDGIAQLVEYGVSMKQFRDTAAPWEDAYGLMAVIVGLSVFRVIDFLPPGQADNRAMALRYLDSLLADDREPGERG